MSEPTQASALPAETEVLVIGAGIGGLGAAAKLLQTGRHEIAVLEAGPDVGGVWRINRYPNVACDTLIDLYAYRPLRV